MTVQEATKKHIAECRGRILRIKEFAKSSKRADVEGCKENIFVLKNAIQALEEVEQYRALGTVEEIEKKIKTELPYMSLAQARFKSELDEYRNIGTVEELKEAREKQIPKKTIDNECPICEELIPRWDTRYCPDCGQKLDREEGGISD